MTKNYRKQGEEEDIGVKIVQGNANFVEGAQTQSPTGLITSLGKLIKQIVKDHALTPGEIAEYLKETNLEAPKLMGAIEVDLPPIKDGKIFVYSDESKGLGHPAALVARMDRASYPRINATYFDGEYKEQIPFYVVTERVEPKKEGGVIQVDPITGEEKSEITSIILSIDTPEYFIPKRTIAKATLDGGREIVVNEFLPVEFEGTIPEGKRPEILKDLERVTQSDPRMWKTERHFRGIELPSEDKLKVIKHLTVEGYYNPTEGTIKITRAGFMTVARLESIIGNSTIGRDTQGDYKMLKLIDAINNGRKEEVLLFSQPSSNTYVSATYDPEKDELSIQYVRRTKAEELFQKEVEELLKRIKEEAPDIELPESSKLARELFPKKTVNITYYYAQNGNLYQITINKDPYKLTFTKEALEEIPKDFYEFRSVPEEVEKGIIEELSKRRKELFGEKLADGIEIEVEGIMYTARWDPKKSKVVVGPAYVKSTDHAETERRLKATEDQLLKFYNRLKATEDQLYKIMERWGAVAKAVAKVVPVVSTMMQRSEQQMKKVDEVFREWLPSALTLGAGALSWSMGINPVMWLTAAAFAPLVVKTLKPEWFKQYKKVFIGGNVLIPALIGWWTGAGIIPWAVTFLNGVLVTLGTVYDKNDEKKFKEIMKMLEGISQELENLRRDLTAKNVGESVEIEERSEEGTWGSMGDNDTS